MKSELISKIRKRALEIQDWMIHIRRRLHQYPETAFQEKNTAKLVCDELLKLGIPFKNHIALTGIIGIIGEDQGESTPIVALRADMDALPIQEETGLSFSSKRPGFMHACGHDGHVAMLLGAANILSAINAVDGAGIRLLFQPAEEGQAGARSMIDDGCLEGVEIIFGGHIDANLPVGRIAVQEGLICAYADGFELSIKGKGGHAARPHEACDALVAASHLVVMVQSILTRKINPQMPSVISIGQLNAGTVPNAIASEATLTGTVRTTEQETRARVFEELERLVRGLETSFGVCCNLRFNDSYPPVINHPEATAIAKKAAEAVVGKDLVIPYPIPSLGGEDFSFYLKHVPGCFVRFGAALKTSDNAPAHSSRFDFNEDVLVTGASFFATCALEALYHLRQNEHKTK